VEWVETTGKTNELAIQGALNALGVELRDAEIVVVSPAKKGVFGIASKEARIRARIKPQLPQRKKQFKRKNYNQDKNSSYRENQTQTDETPRRYRESNTPNNSSGINNDLGEQNATPERVRKSMGGRVSANREENSHRKSFTQSEERSQKNVTRNRPKEDLTPKDLNPKSYNDQRNSTRGQADKVNKDSASKTPVKEVNTMNIEQEAKLANDFITQLIERFGLIATINTVIEESQISIQINGSELGLLVGPKGATLDAIQDITRTIVQRNEEERSARIVVDVAQYREKRAKALAAFVQKIGAEVLENGVSKKLEPMSSPDRKIVHDTITSIQGLKTMSEGFEPRRCVVICRETEEELQSVSQ